MTILFLMEGDKIVFPTFICSDDMSVEHNGVIYQLNRGSNLTELVLDSGINTLIFKRDGEGKVSIRYRGGYL